MLTFFEVVKLSDVGDHLSDNERTLVKGIVSHIGTQDLKPERTHRHTKYGALGLVLIVHEDAKDRFGQRDTLLSVKTLFSCLHFQIPNNELLDS